MGGTLHPWSPGKGTNDPDPWWRWRGGRLCGAIGIACRCHGNRHGKWRRRGVSQVHRSQPGYRLSRGAFREGPAREGRCRRRLDRWRYTAAVLSRLEGRRPSRFHYPARVAGRDREAPGVGRDDEAHAVRRRARQNRATAGREEDTTGHRDRVSAPGCGPGLEGHRPEPARGSWDVAQWAGSGKPQIARQARASCGLNISNERTDMVTIARCFIAFFFVASG